MIWNRVHFIKPHLGSNTDNIFNFHLCSILGRIENLPSQIGQKRGKQKVFEIRGRHLKWDICKHGLSKAVGVLWLTSSTVSFCENKSNIETKRVASSRSKMAFLTLFWKRKEKYIKDSRKKFFRWKLTWNPSDLKSSDESKISSWRSNPVEIGAIC